ncbi:phosphopantothenate--cysteine ligase [Streptococcus catagoni]|uniref:phosphopantothenate--cysteine ligase n=1 Tax=Streptococcus catagoni TaxID=2654874 RepID=UPI00140AD365|nr:phosphopantothenate--cysteine ligase [Streptococcus catagoni]
MEILITSGGTTEKIDAVRGITNHSTGRLGKKLCDLFLNNGHQVTLVTTKTALKPEANPKLSIIEISNVANLLEVLEPLVKKHDVIIHSMAVSDYSPVYMTDFKELEKTERLEDFLEKTNHESKISSQSDYQVLFLKKTPKIISLIKKWNPLITLIGFKLLVGVSSDQLISVARESLNKNQADYILANDYMQITDQKHQAYLVGPENYYPVKTKDEIAQIIYEKVTRHD